ncbi:hypothetical protein L202_00765 [Cryptococcus amylolentus CBS 6039]|uniref:HTH CENPB-type domain-containing protein n=1 Tax=Cryptococcus amylolentus CBS 6039 TaxID=1295533 RepID=A0A1E3I8J8_9TREE|nr:hypothetical protein L202_00765 [Cryptococcus amylolentus CBS 6039]ODN84914.1 hypothetical protein L202_00765 [Cryptococcus amylolentus CBS 6039]
MPPKPPDVEARILNALRAANQQEKPNIAALSREYDVPVKRLRKRYKGNLATKSVHKALDEFQEEALLDWIRFMDKCGLYPTRATVEDSANELLLAMAEDGEAEDAPTVGAQWVESFCQRTQILAQLRQKVDDEADAVPGPRAIGSYFRKFKAVRDEFDIQPSDIWTMDEVIFRIDGKNKPTTGNGPSLTVIEAVNASGDTIPPQIVLPGKRMMCSWFDNDLPDDALVACSDTGHTDDIQALNWIEHFAMRTERTRAGNHSILIHDGTKHDSYTTFQSLLFCEKHNIIPFSLPSNASHILHPLECFPHPPSPRIRRPSVIQMLALNSRQRSSFPRL